MSPATRRYLFKHLIGAWAFMAFMATCLAVLFI